MIEKTQAIVVAVAFGALLAAWGVAHFNESAPLEGVRFSIPQQRYFFALGVHVSAILAIYALLLVVIYGIIMLATFGLPFDCYRHLPDVPSQCKKTSEEFKALNADVLVWSALQATLFVRLALPNIPIIRRVPDRLRDLTRELALFPFARQSLVSTLSISEFSLRNGSDLELGEELARYGVASRLLSCLSKSTTQPLLEVISLRRRLIKLSDLSQAFGAAFLHHASRVRSDSLVAYHRVMQAMCSSPPNS